MRYLPLVFPTRPQEADQSQKQEDRNARRKQNEERKIPPLSKLRRPTISGDRRCSWSNELRRRRLALCSLAIWVGFETQGGKGVGLGKTGKGTKRQRVFIYSFKLKIRFKKKNLNIYILQIFIYPTQKCFYNVVLLLAIKKAMKENIHNFQPSTYCKLQVNVH